MKCLECQTDTSNPKFCSRSCSASYSNKASPKRKATEKFCTRCDRSLGTYANGSQPGSWSRICEDCKLRKPRNVDWDLESKASLRGMGNSNFGGRLPYLRALSRKAYVNSGQPMNCKVCGYSLHVDICHVRDVKDFPEEALVRDINALSNLVALCKNHHWEFDNGHLCLKSSALSN